MKTKLIVYTGKFKGLIKLLKDLDTLELRQPQRFSITIPMVLYQDESNPFDLDFEIDRN